MCMKTVEKGVPGIYGRRAVERKCYEIEHPDILCGFGVSNNMAKIVFAEMCREIRISGKGHHDVSEYKFPSQFESQRQRIGIRPGKSKAVT